MGLPTLEDALIIANSAAMMTLGVGWALLTKGLLAHRSDQTTAHWVLDAALGSFLKGTTVKQKRRLFEMMDGPGVGQARSLHPKVSITQDVDGTWFKSASSSHNAHPDVIILRLHGGGFSTGTPTQAAPALAALVDGVHAQGLHGWLFALDYGLAPEHPFPDALSQVLTKLQTLFEQWTGDGVSAPAIVLSGDSAGGNLVASTLLALYQVVPHLLPRTSPHRPFAGALLLSQWVDLTQQANTFIAAPPATTTSSWLLQLTNSIAALAGAPKLRGLDGQLMPSQPRHVYPCSNTAAPVEGCACQAEHRFRIDNDVVSQSFLVSCMEMYVSGTLAQVKEASVTSNNDAADVHATLLQHVKGSAGSLDSMLAHPLVSPIKADPNTVVQACNQLLAYPALVLAGEYEVLLPDVLEWADRINQAATPAGATLQAKDQKTGNSRPLLLELWLKEVHEAALLPMREKLVPRLSQYLVDAVRSWKGHA